MADAFPSCGVLGAKASRVRERSALDGVISENLFTCMLWWVEEGRGPQWEVWREAVKTFVPVYQVCLLTTRPLLDRRDQTGDQL